MQAALIGALSLLAFLVVWHLLTKYRVVFFVRFTNVPSPLAVYESFTKASHDPKFLMHLLLSCRRIFIGFSLAAIIGVPLGLGSDGVPSNNVCDVPDEARARIRAQMPLAEKTKVADFEAAVLSKLREVDPRDVLEQDTGDDEVLALSAELAAVEGKAAELEAELLRGDVAALAKVLRRLEARKAELTAALAEFLRSAPH